ncbi:MAG: YeeE/YedE family protein, partial [Desulfobacterales bacterium]
MSLIYGLITGILFGILLQKAEVLRYDRQLGALRLMDMTIFKFMLTAIVIGSVGIYLMKDLGLVKLSIKATSIGAQVVGGLMFGIGWALLGYCPGTAGG